MPTEVLCVTPTKAAKLRHWWWRVTPRDIQEAEVVQYDAGPLMTMLASHGALADMPGRAFIKGKRVIIAVPVGMTLKEAAATLEEHLNRVADYVKPSPRPS